MYVKFYRSVNSSKNKKRKLNIICYFLIVIKECIKENYISIFSVKQNNIMASTEYEASSLYNR